MRLVAIKDSFFAEEMLPFFGRPLYYYVIVRLHFLYTSSLLMCMYRAVEPFVVQNWGMGRDRWENDFTPHSWDLTHKVEHE